MRSTLFLILSLICLAAQSQQSRDAKEQEVYVSEVRYRSTGRPDTVPYLNTIHLRAADLLQFCAGVTYERHLVTKRPMSLMFSYSYSFMPLFILNFSPDYIVAAGFRYQFMQYNKNINLFVLPELVYSERSLSLFYHYSSPAAYLSGGAQYRKKRFSFMSVIGAGIAGDAIGYGPSVRIQANVGYAF